MRAFLKNRRGNVALIFALSLLPTTVLVGGSVDLSRMRVERTKLQSAVDAASLAASMMPVNSTDAQIEATVNAYLAANFEGRGALTSTLIDRDGTAVEITATSSVPMTFAALLGADTRPVSAHAKAERGGVNVEVAMVLDVTGSMAGTRIRDLRDAANDLIDIVVQDVQDPYYTRMAIVPYSNAVNLGSRAADVRGAPLGTKTVTNVTWHTGTARTVSSISKASQAVVTTSANHGFVNGDTVWIYGVNGMHQLPTHQNASGPYKVSDKQNKTFKLKDANGNYVSSSSWSNYSTSGGSAGVAKCASTDCRVTLTSNGHGFANNDTVVLGEFTGVWAPLNEQTLTVTNRAANTFVPGGVKPLGMYSSNAGRIYCINSGCEYYRFQEPGSWWSAGPMQTYRISNCVSERIGAQAYTDAAPGANPVGRVYAPTNSECPAAEVMSLTSDTSALHTRIDSLQDSGTTAGQIGLAWGWYMLAPNFNTALGNNAAAYTAPETLKVAILMTDGEFNTAYCNGVLSADSTSLGSSRINCNATNGDPFDQAQELCDAMADEGILVYTVGFELAANSDAADFMEECASDDSYSYLASNGTQLNSAFRAIGDSIGQLRLTR